MKRRTLILPLLAVILVLTSALQNQERQVSLVSEVLMSYQPESPVQASVKDIAECASLFLDSLDDNLRTQAALELESEERQRWTNTPPFGPQGGVRLGDCNDEQLELTLDLLAACLSPQGYQKIRSILLADDELLDEGRPRPGFGAENFWLAIFGKPSASSRWGLQLDGHHLALNLTLEKEQLCLSPSFIGTQPSEFTLDGKQVVPLAGEVHDATELVNSLSEEQRSRAILGQRRGSNQAAAGRDGFIPGTEGLPCTALDEAQRDLLLAVLRGYVGALPETFAEQRLRELEKNLDQLWFSWRGPTTPGSDLSYRIQGPDLIIEFACQDLGGNPLDHLHSMYRDPTNEYGRDLGFAQE
jgi:hypothetical protein